MVVAIGCSRSPRVDRAIQHEAWYTNGDPTERPFAAREGVTITVRPSGASFDIPAEWVKWHDDFSNNLHLTRTQLDAVARCSGEWDTEFGSVCNAALPFDRCCLHIGSEGWGEEAVGFSDLQLRLYDMDGTPEAIELTINGAGAEDIKRFTGKDPAVKQDSEASWRRTVLSFERVYGDYGGTGHLDFRLRQLRGRTFVWVFMYTPYHSQEQTIRAILGSFKLPAVGTRGRTAPPASRCGPSCQSLQLGLSGTS